MNGGHGMSWKETVAFYEEVVGIPMIFRYPKLIQPGVCEVPINTVDIFPTIFDMVGREQLPGVSGKSRLPYMSGKKSVDEAFPYTFSTRISNAPEGKRVVTADMAGHFMVRGKGFKYMVYGTLDGKDSRYSDEPFDILYHLDHDPGEEVDLAKNPEFEAVKKEMNRVLHDWLAATDWKGKTPLQY
jgi:arylsulfatase A-like enzyme